MKEEIKNHILEIEKLFPDSFIALEEFRNEYILSIRKTDVFDILKYLKESKETAFDFLVDITFVDYLKLEGEERFGVMYQLHSYTYIQRLRVKVWVGEDDLNLRTMIPLWKSANWLEREVWDLCGINFIDHPDMRRLLLPDDYVGYPLRKDYPLQGEGFRENFPDLKGK